MSPCRFGAEFILLTAFFCLVGSLRTQPASAQAEAWTAHTSMREVTGLSASDEALWVATTGGVFRYVPATGEVRTYTAADGLHNIETQAIAYDERRRCVWIGYRSGVIDRLDAETGTVRTFRDIERAGRFATRSINRLRMQGDTLFAATAFGLVLFDAAAGEVRDSYTQLGSFPAATSVYDVTVAPAPGGGEAFWLATEQGIAYASVHAANLKDPGAWTAEAVATPTLAVNTVVFFQGSVYAGSARDVLRRTSDGSYVPLGLTTRAVSDLALVGDRLFGTEAFNLFVVEPSGSARGFAAEGVERPHRLAIQARDTLWVGDQQQGLLAVALPAPGAGRADVQTRVVPEGPYFNTFADLTVDEAGNLWASGGRESAGRGFYKLNSTGEWTNYTPAFFEELQGRNGFVNIYVDPQGRFWGGTAGNGLVEVTPENTIYAFDQTNSTLRSPPDISEHFVIVWGITSDAAGRIWVANHQASLPLHVYTPDGDPSLDDWAALPSHVGSTYTYGKLFTDSFGQKWVIVHQRRDLQVIAGVVALDTGDTPDGPADDRFRFFNQEGTAGTGLPSTQVNAVTEDRDGLIWAGTAEGPAYLFNTGVVASDPSAQFIRPQLANRQEGESVFLLNGLAVNDIAVDPANRLWMATEEGVYLVQQAGGGYEIVEHFTTQNSPLFSDNVIAVAVDKRTGRVYFATDQGLISYQGRAIAPAEQVQDLFVYPNPAVFRGGQAPRICIENLVDETEVRILSPHGEVVARFSAQEARGGGVCWDGRDTEQQLVPSGVYLVAAVGLNGEGTAYGKVAVIH